MPGMSLTTGRAVADLDHLRQSIADILLTPIGTRLERRTYGSLLPSLIDQPDNGTTRVRLYAAIASALMRWEPRLRISRVSLASGPAAGQVSVELVGQYVPTSGPARQITLATALTLKAAV